MTFYDIRKAAMLSVLFFGILVLNSCEKIKDSKIGSEIQPEEDGLGINRTDTFTIVTSTLKADSVPTDETSTALLGSVNDPVFGLTSASLYTQLRLKDANNTFENPGSFIIDSVVLILPFNPVTVNNSNNRQLRNYFGDTTSQISYRVFEVTQDFYRDSTYYSNSALSTGEELSIGSNVIAPSPNTPVKIGADSTVSPQLRIRIKNEYATRIITTDAATLASNDKFVQTFKGIYITAENQGGTGNLVNINATSDFAQLTVYYKDGSENKTFNLGINQSARFTSFNHNYNGTPVQNQLSGAATGEQEVYVQSGGGVKTRLTIPYLTSLSENRTIAVNKAELILPVAENSSTTFAPNFQLLVTGVNNEGKLYLLPDFIEEGRYDGFYQPADNLYRVNITQYVQQLLNGTRANNGFHILANLSAISAGRTVLNGYGNPAARPKLVVTYTEL